jgi:zinc and cadmium transporter
MTQYFVAIMFFMLLPLIGGYVGIYIANGQIKWVKLLLAFSGGFLLGTAIIHIIPEVIEQTQNYGTTAIDITLFIVLGFFMQLLLENFSEGIEHGHLHVDAPHGHDHAHDHSHFHNSNFISTTLLLSICVHAFIEGMPLNGTFSINNSLLGNSLFWGIILHKLPASFALAIIMNEARLSFKRIMLYLFLFSLMTPLGILVGNGLMQYNSYGLQIVTAIVAGSFLNIATSILYESAENHKLSFMRLLFAFLGALTVLFF